MTNLTAQIDRLDEQFQDRLISVDEYFAQCERLMEAARSSGAITEEEYCQLEQYAGF